MKSIVKSIFSLLITSVGLLSFFVYAQAVAPLPQAPSNPQSQNTQSPMEKIEAAKVYKENNPCDPKTEITLNINIPFIGRCIKKDPSANQASDAPKTSTIGNVFPMLMGGLIRLTMTLVYVIGFLCILAGGFMIAGNGALGTKEKGKKLIIAVVAGLILLGASGVILNMINPDFFGTDSGA